MKYISLFAVMVLAACSTTLDEQNHQLCEQRGLSEGTAAFSNCLRKLERRQWEQMRATERDINRTLEQQERIREDYRLYGR